MIACDAYLMKPLQLQLKDVRILVALIFKVKRLRACNVLIPILLQFN